MPRIIPIEEWRDDVPVIAGTPPINPYVCGSASPIPAPCEPTPTVALKVDYFRAEPPDEPKRRRKFNYGSHDVPRQTQWEQDERLRQRDREMRRLAAPPVSFAGVEN